MKSQVTPVLLSALLFWSSVSGQNTENISLDDNADNQLSSPRSLEASQRLGWKLVWEDEWDQTIPTTTVNIPSPYESYMTWECTTQNNCFDPVPLIGIIKEE